MVSKRRKTLRLRWFRKIRRFPNCGPPPPAGRFIADLKRVHEVLEKHKAA